MDKTAGSYNPKGFGDWINLRFLDSPFYKLHYKHMSKIIKKILDERLREGSRKMAQEKLRQQAEDPADYTLLGPILAKKPNPVEGSLNGKPAKFSKGNKNPQAAEKQCSHVEL